VECTCRIFYTINLVVCNHVGVRIIGSGDIAIKREERIHPKMKNNHPTVKPIKLMEYLIKLVSRKDTIILDPFTGSGTTAIACLNTNRKYICIEKDENYFKISQERIKNHKVKYNLFKDEAWE
jgi:DNA modification methylase